MKQRLAALILVGAAILEPAASGEPVKGGAPTSASAEGFDGCYLSPSQKAGPIERGTYAYSGEISFDKENKVVGGHRGYQEGDYEGLMQVACSEDGRLSLVISDGKSDAPALRLYLKAFPNYIGDFSDIPALADNAEIVRQQAETKIFNNGYKVYNIARVVAFDEAGAAQDTNRYVIIAIQRGPSGQSYLKNLFSLGTINIDTGILTILTIGTNYKMGREYVEPAEISLQ